nr:MltA domain-containing protein [Aurantiacibacter aquimixticola]
MRRLLSLCAIATLSACGPMIPAGDVPATAGPVPSTAAALGVIALPLSAIAPRQADAAAALRAFRRSCPVALRREDVSGLTRMSDWQLSCDAAASWPERDASRFFASYFTPVRVGEGQAFATGYFEPEIRGGRQRRSASDVPVYGVPPDLERCWRDDMAESERDGRAPLSRRLPDGRCIEHFTRAEIEDGALEGNATPIIGYASDPIEFFFLQIQGSGRLVTDTGEVMRIGYANQNGHGYTGIGALMRQRGLIGDGTPYATSMQGIVQYLRDHPAQGRAIMRENESWVFFRELIGPDAQIGPLGSIGVPVVREASVAVDPRYVPYGAPVLLDLDRDVADGLWIAQDTGGAIKGPNRFDTFWGAGEDAREIAGGMSGRGSAVVLLPREAAARLAR